MFLYMFSLSACARSSVIGKPNLNNVCFFNTVLANQNNRAQSFPADSNILPHNDQRQYRNSFDFAGFLDHFPKHDYSAMLSVFVCLDRFLQIWPKFENTD